MTQEGKLDKILETITEMKVELAKSIVHQENHTKKLADHEEKINVLDAHRNNLVGKQTIISLVCGSVGAAVLSFFK